MTNEWEYKLENLGHVNRIQQRRFTEKEKSVPLTWRTLAECLDPQPRARVVIKDLLEYIDRCDAASMDEGPKPPFCTTDGSPIFPEGEKWWLTDLSIRKEQEEDQGADSDVIDPELPIEEDDQRCHMSEYARAHA